MAHDSHTGGWHDSAAPGSTSSSLLERVKARDPNAWPRMCDLYGPYIYRWCRRAGLQQADAADIAQEVFRTVAAKIAEFQLGRPGGFRAWLQAITRNKIGDHLRRRRGHAQGQGGTAAQDQLQQIAESLDSASAADAEAQDNLLPHRALSLVRSEFADRTWQAFWLVVAEGRSPAEVARQLGTTLAAVYMAKSRVLCRLRQELDAPPT
jgi:RNA polymerase sigma-70 factor (ECF subfamily)